MEVSAAASFFSHSLQETLDFVNLVIMETQLFLSLYFLFLILLFMLLHFGFSLGVFLVKIRDVRY